MLRAVSFGVYKFLAPWYFTPLGKFVRIHMNIIIKDKRSDKIKQIEDRAKSLLKDCYKQECRQEEHTGREIGEGSFTKSQIKRIWESEKLNHILSTKVPESEDSGIYE